MIQRIQSIYLLIVAGLLVAAACLPVAYFADATGEYALRSWGIEMGDVSRPTWGLLAILVVSAIVAFATIFLFKNRKLQIRMTILNDVLLIGYYLSFVAFYMTLKDDVVTFRMSSALCVPLIAIILNALIIRAIRRDEAIVKAAYRLR